MSGSESQIHSDSSEIIVTFDIPKMDGNLQLFKGREFRSIYLEEKEIQFLEKKKINYPPKPTSPPLEFNEKLNIIQNSNQKPKILYAEEKLANKNDYDSRGIPKEIKKKCSRLRSRSKSKKKSKPSKPKEKKRTRKKEFKYSRGDESKSSQNKSRSFSNFQTYGDRFKT